MRITAKGFLLRLLYIPIIPYVAFAIFAWFFTDSLIFLPRPGSYPETSDVLKLRSTSGRRISAQFLPNPSARYTLLVSHGNAEDLGDTREWLNALRNAGFNVFAYDYQGYGTSEGRPSERGAYDDEIAAYDYLTHELKTPPDRVIILGRSVGTGPAVHLAARRPAAALILQSPFLSAFRVVTKIPILPFDKFPNYKDIGRVRCPVLIIHGTQDNVVPYWHGEKLYALANQPKQFFSIKGAGHNDEELSIGPSYLKAIEDLSNSLPSNQGSAHNLP